MATKTRNTSQYKMHKLLHHKVCFCSKRSIGLEPPEGIRNVFNEYSHNGRMSMDDLCKFLVEFQGEEYGDATNKHAKAVIDRFQRRSLDVEAFFRYLLSDDNNAHLVTKVHHDMKFPLAHYFLYTNYNSSMLEDLSTIINALKRGVRVIELDIWPDPGSDEVRLHSNGRGSMLKACLNAIKDNAFSTNHYPVIITFEDHLPLHLQAKVGVIIKGIFGDMLFRPDPKYIQEFPSPEKLKKKILISTKPSNNREHQMDEGHDSFQYQDLISISEGKSKANHENGLIKHNQVRRHSLSEQKLEYIESNGTDIIRCTRRNIFRIGPEIMQMDPSNYGPMIGWMRGVQMVSLHMQSYDEFHCWMEGMFRANGGCGYVKKPNILLNIGPNDEVFDPRASRPIQKTLQVLVYMGEGWKSEFSSTDSDHFSSPNFSVEVSVLGVPADRVTSKTRTIENNWEPLWKQEFSFPLTVPELALLYIKVINHTSQTHDFGGQTCLPVSELREGIRRVCLYDRTGKRYKSVKLLIQFLFVQNTE